MIRHRLSWCLTQLTCFSSWNCCFAGSYLFAIDNWYPVTSSCCVILLKQPSRSCLCFYQSVSLSWFSWILNLLCFSFLFMNVVPDNDFCMVVCLFSFHLADWWFVSWDSFLLYASWEDDIDPSMTVFVQESYLTFECYLSLDNLTKILVWRVIKLDLTSIQSLEDFFSCLSKSFWYSGIVSMCS